MTANARQSNAGTTRLSRRPLRAKRPYATKIEFSFLNGNLMVSASRSTILSS